MDNLGQLKGLFAGDAEPLDIVRTRFHIREVDEQVTVIKHRQPGDVKVEPQTGG